MSSSLPQPPFQGSSQAPSQASNELAYRARTEAILTFWFGAPDSKAFGQYRKQWFLKNDEFDRQIRQRFITDIEKAASGDYDHWQSSAHSSAESAMALLLLLDQFPRNVYRGSPQSFATDGKASQVASYLVDTGLDQTMPPVYRFFVYVPFEHQEAIASQNRAVALMSALVNTTPNLDEGLKNGLDFAIRHRDVIKRFGRFPHRNEILGRPSTAEEAAFLQQPGSRF
ncbi:MAG: DUF924 family protein [Cyanobacteria bacterium P01_D01_bin.105]